MRGLPIHVAVSIAAVLLTHSGGLRAQGTDTGAAGSTNLDRLETFWQAVERSNGPVTVLAFGDSMAASYQSIQYELFKRLQTRLGTSGYALRNYRNTILWQYGAGAALAERNTNWWTAHGTLPPGGFIYWTNQNHATGSLLCDQVGLYWVAHPNGGSFNLSVSTNGQAWSGPLLTLDGFASHPTGCYTHLPLARLNYRLRVDGVSGTNTILGPDYVDTTSAGIKVAFLDQGGADLNGVFSLPTNVLHPILLAANPHLVVYHMKELGDLGDLSFSNRLFDLEALWRACVPKGDVVYLGTPYDCRDATQEWTPRENRLLRQAAVRDQRAYLDCMTPCVSYETMVAKGFISDGIHPNNAGNAFLADLVWRELGFFALRTDRRLTLQLSNEAVCLAWPTTTNIAYALQCSTNLSNWTVLQTIPGDGLWHSHTNACPGPPNAVFRLRLTPD